MRFPKSLSFRRAFTRRATRSRQPAGDVLNALHSRTASWVNRLDGAFGRKVWHNYRETRLTSQRSYLARLNYVHQNAVKHGLVRVASHYRWCSASWFERTATPAQVRSIYRFKVDRLQVVDDFEVSAQNIL